MGAWFILKTCSEIITLQGPRRARALECETRSFRSTRPEKDQ